MNIFCCAAALIWVGCAVLLKNPPTWPLVGVLLFCSAIFIYVLTFRKMLSALEFVFRTAALSSLFMSLYITYGLLTDSLGMVNVCILLLLYYCPLFLLFPIMRDCGRHRDAAIIALSATMPFGFVVHFFAKAPPLVFLTSKNRHIIFVYNTANNFICSLNMTSGAMISAMYVQPDIGFGAGFVFVGLLIYVTIPSFLVLIFFHFLHGAKKYSFTEAVLLISTGIVPYTFIVYLAYVAVLNARQLPQEL